MEEEILDGNQEMVDTESLESESSTELNEDEQSQEVIGDQDEEQEQDHHKNISSTVPKERYIEERRQRQELERRLEALENQSYQPQSKQETIPDEDEEALEVLAPILDKYAKSKGLLTREEREEEIRQENVSRAINNQIKELKTEFNGKDGKPKFTDEQLDDVIAYGRKHGIFNIRKAYEDMKRVELANYWLNSARKPVKVPAHTAEKKNSMPDFDKMSSDEIMKWQQSQGLSN